MSVKKSRAALPQDIKVISYEPTMKIDFEDITEFNHFFFQEATCCQYLEQIRWNSNPVCPHCGTAKKPNIIKSRSKIRNISTYRCTEWECNLPFTVLTGTIFERTRIPMRKWFHAAFELASDKNGMSSTELGRKINVSQKTAWFMNHRLRALMTPSPKILKGVIEVDEYYMGGLEKNKHSKKKKRQGSGTVGKVPVVGLLSREGDLILKVYSPEDEMNSKRLHKLLKENVHKDSVIITDGFPAYTGLDQHFAEHEVVKHSQGEYAREDHHINTIEGFWAILSLAILDTFRGVSPQHMHRYCDEFGMRYSSRDITEFGFFKNCIQRFDKARLKYKDLTANGKKRETWKLRAIKAMKTKQLTASK